MSDELKRIQELAGVPVNEKKESLNEHYVAGGIVGVGAINQIPPREKSDYEMAFEHFMTEGEEKEEVKEETSEPHGNIGAQTPEGEVLGFLEEDEVEEAVGIPASAEAIRNEVIKMMNNHRSDSDLGAAIRKKFSPKPFDSQELEPTTMKDREAETRRRFAQRGMGAI